MRTINNQFSKTQIIPKISITDSNGTTVTFGGDDATYGRVYEVNISADIDRGYTADMSFVNHEDAGPSLDPLHSTSDFNDGTISTNLMSEYNNVKIELSKDSGSNYYTVYEGFVGDVTARKQVDKNDIIDFSPYGKSKALKDVPILEDAPNQPYEYYDIDAFDCIDQILSDNGYSLTLNRAASGNPTKTVTEYKVKNTNVWDALKEVIASTGYKLLFKPVSDSVDLVVIDPNRSASGTPDHTFAGDFSQRRIEHTDRDVRTKVVVFYNDRDTGERKRETVSDSTALSKYGADDFGGGKIDRTMVLKEDDKSLIDTSTEASAFANYALNDLKEPSPDIELDFEYGIPGIDLYDIVEAGGTGDYTPWIGVTSISYSFSVDRQIGNTTIRGSANRVIGEKSYWLNKGQLPDDIDAQKGDRSAPPKPENAPRLEKSTYVDGSGTTRAKVVCYGSHNPAWDVISYQFRYRVIDTRDDNIIDWVTNILDAQWKYPDQVKNPQKTITGLEVGNHLQLEVEYSAIDWENTEWSGLPGDSPYSDTGTVSLYADITPPSTPTGLTISEEIESLELNWTAPTTSKDGSDLTDLNYYNVYYKSGDMDFAISNADGSIDEVDSTTLTQHLPANTQRSYKIEAVDDSFNKSSPSSYASGTTKAVVDSDIQISGWSSDLTFSSTDTDTVSWTSGTLTTGGGNSYSINSGNTGNMSSTTYIYFDLNTSSTDLQTTTSTSTSVGSDKILVAVAENATDGAKFQVFGGQGGQFITAEEIAANTITANELATNSATVTEIYIGSELAISSGGAIKSDDSTGLGNGGFWLGDSGSGNWDFSIGSDLSTSYLKYDQSAGTLDYRGTLNASDLNTGTINFTDVGKSNLTVSASNGEISIDASLDVTGNIKCASNNVQLGQNVGPNNINGISVQSGGKIEITDASNRTIFDSAGDFIPAPVINTGAASGFFSGQSGTGEHTANLATISGIESKQYLVFIRVQYDDALGYCRVTSKSGDYTITDRGSNFDPTRGTQSVRVGGSWGWGYIITDTNSSAQITWKAYEDHNISLWLDYAIPIDL